MRRLVATAALLVVFPASVQASVGEGSLVTRRGERLVDIPVEHTEVRIRVDGYLASVEVEQRFVNPWKEKIEAIYAFPLPTGAAVDKLELLTGDEVIAGAIHPRAEARRIYEVAKKRGRIAALLEEERGNLFTQSVANIEPGARVTVKLHYFAELPYDAGTYELVFPLVASPRYIPGASEAAAAGKKKGKASGPGVVEDTTEVADASRVTPHYLPPDTRSSHDVGLTVELEAGVVVADPSSPSHRIDVTRTGPSAARITLAAGDTIPNKDFVLRYRVAGKHPTAALVPHRSGREGDAGAFFLMIQPPSGDTEIAAAPRELVFVVDTSSSMEGAPLAKAKEVIGRSLKSLRPDDTFQIVRFSDRASALGARPIANSPANVRVALEWLDKLRAGGGTEMTDGVSAALGFPHDPARLRMVLFLTDGYIGNEDAVLRTVHDHLGPARVFPFGVGTAVNRYLLEEMAALGRGSATIVRPDEKTDAAVDRFLDRIATPVLTDLEIDWGGLPVSELTPAAPPDLFLGQPLVLHGRYDRAATGTVTVHGTLAGRRVKLPISVTLPERRERPAVAAVWAKAKIREHSRALLKKADPKRVAAITELSLQHGILTRYTAFVAVSERTTGGGDARTVPVPLERPEGLKGFPGRGHGFASGVTAGAAMAFDPVDAFDGDGGGGMGGGGMGYGGAPDGPYGGPVAAEASKAASPKPVTKTPIADITLKKAEAASSGSEHSTAAVASTRGVGVSAPLADKKKGGSAASERARIATLVKKDYRSTLAGCREKAMGRGVAMGKTLRLEVDVSEGGVDSAAVGSSGDAAFADCVRGAAKHWRFDGIKKAKRVAVFVAF